MAQSVGQHSTVYAANGEAYNYYAFISYSRKDEAWAKWLQKKMEQYRLPTILRKEESTLPKRIHPVFRDKTDLTTGQLQTALHQELDTSKKLIVICSPASARSEWVNKEVQRLIDQGRAGDIIPLIVEGIPNSADETECFPPALKLPEDEQILGVSVPELGKGDAFLRVVAGLLDIKFDQLKRRHEQRKKRNMLITAACVLLFLAAATFGGFKAWDYYAPHEAYYADYVLRWGVPEGIAQLTKQETREREGHYTLVTQRGQIRKLVFANSDGTPMEHLETEVVDRPMIALYYYTDEGQLSHVEYVDINGKVLSTQVYTTDLKAVDFQVSASDSALQTLASSTTSTSTGAFELNLAALTAQRSDISRYLLEYDTNGYVTKRVYMRDRRTPIVDGDGIGGIEYVLDEWGRPTEVHYLSLNGESYTATKKDLAGKRYSYDNAGNWTRIEYFDSRGELCFNEEGWMAIDYTYDNNGNNTQRTNLDANGEVTATNLGYASALFGYNERGNYISAEYFDADGERASHKAASAIIRKEYDNRGRIIRQSYFDANDEPTLNPSGIAVEEFSYDMRGNYAGGRWLGTDGEPVFNSNGYASLTIEYDARGNHAAESFFGTDGKPLLNNEGIASWLAEYDNQNNQVSMEFFGTDGKLTLHNNGYAVREDVYDDRSNPVRLNFFGTDRKPILCADGYASVEYTYDEGGNIIAHHYFGLTGEPLLNSLGFAALEADIDDRGNPAALRLLGLNGELVNSTDEMMGGYAVMKGTYNERGRLELLSFFDASNEPVLVQTGWASMGFELDERDNIIATTCYGTDGLPILCSEGYASVKFTYDRHGNPVGLAYCGTDGNLIAIEEGYAEMRTTFDERGNSIEVIYLDAEGNVLPQQVITITPLAASALEVLGVKAGDVIIAYGPWEYFREDPDDTAILGYASAINALIGETRIHSALFYKFILAAVDIIDAPQKVTLYRPSTGETLDFAFPAAPDFEFNDLYVTEQFYQALPGASQGTAS